MKKHFYSHIIEIETLHTSLEVLELKPHEKEELHYLIESNVHHIVLDTMLTELSEKDKKEFLSHVISENHKEIWKILEGKVPNAERKIKEAVEELKKEMNEDIKEAHKKKK